MTILYIAFFVSSSHINLQVQFALDERKMSTIDAMPGEGAESRGLLLSLAGKAFSIARSRYHARLELRRTRIRLFELTDGELEDIGVTRDMADREATRSLLACYLNNAR